MIIRKILTASVFLLAFITPGVSEEECGEVLQGLQGEVTHPEYPEPYAPLANCRWSTIARPKDNVVLFFDLLDIEADTNGQCQYDYVSIFFDAKENPERYCGRPENRDPNLIYRTEEKGDPIIRFKSDDNMQFAGFKLTYTITRYDYCLDEPCENDGRCILQDSTEDGYICACYQGWEGKLCEEDVDECQSNPCQNGGTCSTPEFNSYECDCVPGYTGDNCEIDIDECESEPCQNEGECVDEINSYYCECAAGFEGRNCETEINECESDPCKNGGSCLDEVARYLCRCMSGYVGNNCGTEKDECDSDPCENGGICHDGLDRYDCECDSGFEGNNCEIDIEECASDPCQNDARCFESEPGMFFCACPPGFTGIYCEHDVDECDSNPCYNLATCQDRPNGFRCDCLRGYIGEFCDLEVNECESNPCLNGGTCRDEIDHFTCQCEEMFSGYFCNKVRSHCDSNPCSHGGECFSFQGGYFCTCVEGFSGINCQTDIDECESDPCLNGGTCEDGPNRYDCICTDGYGGVHCEIELDECDSGPCENGANCIDFPSKFECICEMGYEGKTCQFEEDSPCASEPCENDGTCEEDEGKYKCICVEGYAGNDCEKEVGDDEDDNDEEDENECPPYSCHNNGVCEQLEDDISCECDPGFSGIHCETDIDECESDPCTNGGSCVDRPNEYWCICRDGYEGDHCEDDSNADWKRDSHLLASIVSSLIFLITIGILTALFITWVRKKRSAQNRVKNINVKPAPEKRPHKPKTKSKPKPNPKFPKKRPHKKKEREEIVEYDSTPDPYKQDLQTKDPYISEYPETSYKTPSKVMPRPPQYSTVPGVAMVYPTENPVISYPTHHFPQYPNIAFDPTGNFNPYPQPINMDNIPYYNNQGNHPFDDDPYNNTYYKDKRKNTNHSYEQPVRMEKPHKKLHKKKKPHFRMEIDDDYMPLKSAMKKRNQEIPHNNESMSSRVESNDDISEIDLDDYDDPPSDNYIQKRDKGLTKAFSCYSNPGSILSHASTQSEGGIKFSEKEWQEKMSSDKVLRLKNDLEPIRGHEPRNNLKKNKGNAVAHIAIYRDPTMSTSDILNTYFKDPRSILHDNHHDCISGHWQDRDNMRLNNVPDEHREIPDFPETRQDDPEYIKERHQGKRPRHTSVTFREPNHIQGDNWKPTAREKRNNDPTRSLAREKTGFFPSKTKLHRRIPGEEGRKTKAPEKQRNKVQRRQGTEPGILKPVTEQNNNADMPRQKVFSHPHQERSRKNPKNNDRFPPEGDSGAISGESDFQRQEMTKNNSDPYGNGSHFKLIRRGNSLNVNKGRGFNRENAFFQNN